MEQNLIEQIGNQLCVDDEITLQQIDYAEDKSSMGMNRVKMHFKNGYALSIIHGSFAYCDGETFEIAPFNKNDELDGRLFDEDDRGDDVLGYCTLEKVSHYIKKLAYLL